MSNTLLHIQDFRRCFWVSYIWLKSSTGSGLSPTNVGDTCRARSQKGVSMIRAWYRVDGDKDLDAQVPDPARFVSLEEMMSKTGIKCMKFNSEKWSTDPEYAALKKNRGYNYEDTVVLCPEVTPDYDQMMKNFATEHIHADEEIRFVVTGTCYFDFRDWDDRWIRLEANKDDLIILPAGIYHRFFVPNKAYMEVKRLFSGTPCWIAFYRPEADNHPARKDYVRKMSELKQAFNSK